MARSANNSAYPSYLPRSWRVVTIAGVTTVGLGIGLVQPAPAEWLKQSAKPPARSSTRPVPAENGFTGTIRRLMSDSRRAAEQGDYAKAVQLAERAAKISEATAQLLGPTSECSPQETSRFLAEMRAAQNGTAPAIATQPQSAAPAAPVAPAAQIPPRAAASPPLTAAAKPTVKGAATPAAAARQAQPAVASMAKPQSPPAVPRGPQNPGTGSRAGAAPVPGNVTIAGGTRNPSSKQASQAGHTQAKSAQPAVPPVPAKATSTADQLLAQSRIAAAAGDLDSAIELAQKATLGSQAPSFFGAGGGRPQNTEATRWLERLVAQRDAQPQRAVGRQGELNEEVFEPPIRVASKPPRKARETEPVVAPVGNETVDDRTGQTPSIEPAVASRSAEANPSVAQTANPAHEPLWAEELPEADRPTSAVVPEPVKFTRRSIDASAGWVDADAMERTASVPEARPTVAETQLATDRTSDTTTLGPMDSDEVTPEYSVGDVPLKADAPDLPVASDEPEVALPTAEAETVEPAVEAPAGPEEEAKSDEAPSEASPAVSERGPLRLRQHISQMPEMDPEPIRAEVEPVVTESPAKVVERAPLRFRKQPVQTADFTAEPVSEPAPQAELAESVASSRGPLRLRPQIQQVAAEWADAAKQPAATPQRPAQPVGTGGQPTKTLPRSFAEIPAESIEAAADEAISDAPVQRFPVQRVLRLRQRIEEATSLNPGGHSADNREPFTEERQSTDESFGHDQAGIQEGNRSIAHEPAQSTTRPAVKLRERTRLKLDDPTAESSSTAVPRAPIAIRPPVIARSESNLWKSVDSTNGTAKSPANEQPATAATQPMLPPPITQAGFESDESKSTDLQKTGLSVNDSANEAKSDFDIAPPPPEAAESHPWHEDSTHEKSTWKSDVAVRKSSFALIDQLADAFHVPAKTLVSLIMGTGAVLVAGGLLAMRAAMRRRHSA